MLKTYVNRETISYLIFGVLTTVVDFLVYKLMRVMNMHYLYSQSIAWSMAVLFAFFTNKFIVFRSSNTHIKMFFREFVSFVIVRILSLFLNLGGLWVFLEVIQISEWITKVLLAVIVVLINYLFSKLFVFKERSPISNSSTGGGALNTKGDKMMNDVKLTVHNDIRTVRRVRVDDRELTWFKSVDGLILAFLLPLLAMIIIYIQRGIFPFGDKSFLRTDLYHQYAPFFSEFQYKLKNGGSLLYSWNIGLGVNFSALYAYYLASPLNWFVVLVPKSYLLEFMTYMIAFKIALCGLSFAYYLSTHSRRENVGIAFFGTFYALSGYMAAYNWNIMWLDCIILFPLICLGIERLIFKKRGLLYAITLGISILSNYYISIMICIFMVIYFFALCILKNKMSFWEFLVSGFRFGFYSILAGGLSAIVLVPEVFALRYTASSSVNFPKVFVEYFSIISMFARHMPGVETEIGLEHWPNIYCGVAIYIFIVLYILNKKIDLKEKIVYFVLTTILLTGFSVDALNYIWHGMHYPNSLPARQSFIYIFLILYISYRAFYNFRWNSLRDLGIASFTSILFVLFAQHMVKEEHFHFMVFYASMILLALYAHLLYHYKSQKRSINLLVLATIFVVFMEAMLNTGVTSVSTIDRTQYISDNIAVQRLVENIPKTPFYRFEKVNRKTKNDGAWMNFRSVSLFSSTAQKSLSDFFRKVGIESSTNAYSITGSTPLVDMLFGVKYGIYTGESKISYLSLAGNIEDIYMYENPYTLPLGYMVGPGLEEAWDLNMDNPADVQNRLAQIVGAPNVLVQEEGRMDGQDFYSFTTSKEGQYYIFVTNPGIENIRVKMISTGIEHSYEHVNRRYMLDIGYLEAGEEIMVSNTDSKFMDMVAYRFDINALAKVYDQLSISTWDTYLIGDNYIEGVVEAGSDLEGQEVLMTSIPYDKGWKVMVDGVEVVARRGLDAFMAIELAPGVHKISMEYMPEGQIYGAIISAGSFVLILLIFIIGSIVDLAKRRRRAKVRAEVDNSVKLNESTEAAHSAEKDKAKESTQVEETTKGKEVGKARESTEVVETTMSKEVDEAKESAEVEEPAMSKGVDKARESKQTKEIPQSKLAHHGKENLYNENADKLKKSDNGVRKDKFKNHDSVKYAEKTKNEAKKVIEDSKKEAVLSKEDKESKHVATVESDKNSEQKSKEIDNLYYEQ